MSIETKERGIQDALGLGKEFNVTIEFDGTCVAHITKQVKAVSDEDAKEQVLKILDIVTDAQLHGDIVGANNRGPGGVGNGGFTNLTVNRNSVRITNVYKMHKPKSAKSAVWTGEQDSADSADGVMSEG